MATDAFGRLRTSDVFTIFEYYPSAVSSVANSSLDEDIWVTEQTGTTNTDFNSSTYIALNCQTDSSSITRKTKLPMDYQPGKSRLFYLSSVPLSRSVDVSENVVVKIGCFDSVEGHYFKTNGQTLSWVEYYNSIEDEIVQSSWNIDTFDGTGPSGLTVNINSMLDNILFVIDQEWLGVGRVRVGFNLNGVNYYAHQFIHSNAYPYTTTPRLPLCYNIDANVINSSIETRQICCTCLSEGGFTPLGKRMSIATNLAGVPLLTNSNKYILLSLRIGTGFDSGILKPLNTNILYPEGSASKWLRTEIQLHSTNGSVGSINGTLTYNGLKDSISEYAIGDGSQTINTDGFVIFSNFVNTNSTLNFAGSEYETLLTRAQISKYDTLYIIVEPNTNNTDVVASLDFIETT